MIRRREWLAAAAAACTLPPRAMQAAAPPRRLRATPASVALAGQPALAAWAYEGRVHGPTLRYRRGALLDVELENALPDPTTIHWHGVRVPNAMDGVPHITQPPVAPGERFRYRFTLPDSGTFWYHPHLGTPEQVARGLSGALIVEDEDGPEAEHDWLWLLADWRLDASGRIAEDFYDYMDVSHAGRLGAQVTLNGRSVPGEQQAAPGERVRLRLVNAAPARIFALRFAGATPWVIALDGAPLAQVQALGDTLLPLGPGMRADLILDLPREPGARVTVHDVFGRGERQLATVVADGAPARTGPARTAPRAPAPNPLPEPVPQDAQAETLVLGGGMMSMGGWPDDPLPARLARRLRRMGGAREADPVWSVNGQAHLTHDPAHAPEFEVARGRTVRLTFENRTAWWHPMHLHGHSFRELARNGRPPPGRAWRDTMLVAPRESVEVAFVADNPGDWLIHCHVLEHHAGGMGTRFRVSA
ncbi:MAG: multicopper oxidase family protein [Rubrivivax sp.]|nr:multicopper oxidase family protein [Rubrivivax sp.]